MTRDIALAASNLLEDIELCDDVVDRIQQIKIDLELDNSDIVDVLENAKQGINNYKNILEIKLEEL